MSEASRAWSWRHAFSSSSLPATTKHVLHTLGMFMNELGEGCYPSVSDICRYSGLDKKTVLKHLATARDAGWIAVSQHGYRGQKWKRQEYAARWPERDLTASCPPEGGGTPPPPSAGSDVVESAPEGGGIEGPKVVEQVHQDKTSPVTTPDTSPVEREARASEREEGQPPEPVNRKSIERAFERAFQAWPTSISDSRPEALKAWLDLAPEEREAAFAEAGRYAEAARATGRKHLCSHAVYLREKRWQALAPREEAEKPKALEAKPFGPLWQAARVKHLLAGPTVEPTLTRIDRVLIEEGKFSEAELLREKQARNGFPAIHAMHDKASFRQSVTVSLKLQPLAEMMEPVPVGSERFEEWREEHARRGWPWLPDTGAQPVVYFPQGGPAGLDEFEAAVKRLNEGCGNDGGQREAAE